MNGNGKNGHDQTTLPTVLVIFGATGDLAQKKLIPALFHMFEKKKLPPVFQVVGFSRRKLGHEEFRKLILEFLGRSGSAEDRERFARLFYYVSGIFESKKGYEELAKFVGSADRESRVCSNKLFYLAVPPAYYEGIFKRLAASGLTVPCSPGEGWTKVAVEKPFGKDLKTAVRLDALLGRLFKEEQIYRIDHVLAKETVQNVLAFRFSNSFLDPIWNNQSIARIDIRYYETQGIEGRGQFYDGTGALRDVGQNHLLQVLALFTMNKPAIQLDGAGIRRERAKILGALRLLAPSEVPQFTLRGQYGGYKKEKGVLPASDTETYFKLKTFIQSSRWAGVPIYLEAGKKMAESKFDVKVTFRHPVPCACPEGTHYENVLVYRIQPDEKISISFWVKRPGSDMVLEQKDFSFDYKKEYSNEIFMEAYEKLLLDALAGRQMLFVSTPEILSSWKFADPILQVWRRRRAALLDYPAGNGEIAALPVPADATGTREIGFVGIGKMGRNMAIRLAERGWRVLAYDRDPGVVADIAAVGAEGAADIAAMVKGMSRPRHLWLMVPAGKPVDEVLFGKDSGLVDLLEPGDTVIDGGNSHFEDSVRRAAKLKKQGIHFLDAGTSGGPGGARNGACIMVGGDKRVFARLEHLFEDLALPGGYLHVGKAGAGHFVKMVHNGIEYGMMQALAEGFAVLKSSRFGLNLPKIADLYNHGSVIESRLVGWLKAAYESHGEDLADISGSVGHTGEGEWTVKAAKKLKVPADVIEKSFRFRVKSKRKPSYTGKVLSALRQQFGGHAAK